MNIDQTIRKLNRNVVDSKELKDCITELIDCQFNNYSIVNLTNLIMNYVAYVEMKNEDKYIAIMDSDNELNTISIKIQNLVNSFGEISLPAIEDRNKLINDLTEYKKKIANRVEVITGYNDIIEIFETILQKYSLEFCSNEDNVDIKKFSGEIIQFTFSKEQNVIINDKIKSILKILPIRLTKQKILDYISQSMSIYNGAYKNDLENFIKFTEETFYPEGINGYGKYYQTIYEKLNLFYDINYNDLSQEEIKSYLQQLKDLTTKLEDILNICNMIVEIINRLIGLLYHEDFDINTLMQDEFYVVNIIKIINIIKNNEKDDNLEEMINHQLESLEGIQEKWIDKIDKYDSSVDTINTKHKKFVQNKGLYNKIEKLLCMRIINSSNYYVDYNEYLANLNKEIIDEQVDKAMLNSYVENLLEYIGNKYSNMNKQIRRARVNQLLSLLPPAFTKPQQFYQFIYDSLVMCTSENEFNCTYNKIKKLMVDYL